MDRAFLNGFVDMICHVQFNVDANKSKHGDHMYIETALAVWIMIHGLGLTKIA